MHCNNLLSTLIKIVMKDAIKPFDLWQYHLYIFTCFIYKNARLKMLSRMFIICYQTNVCIKSYPCN